MKKILLLCTFVILSCNSNVAQLEDKIVKMKRQNDSLQNIIDTLNTKYIFDRAYLCAEPMLSAKYNKDEITGFVTIIAENKSDKILMIHEDKNDKINPLTIDTLTMQKGFTFKFKRSETDTTRFRMVSVPKYGKPINSMTSDPLNYYP